MGLTSACGGESESAPAQPTATGTETASPDTETATATAPAAEPAAPPAPAEPPPVPEGELVDLLHAVRTEVATSSAYQDRDSQVRALVDGDLETAWNSRTDDLQGAWIEVRIPEGARVQSIRMTAGFTKTGNDGSDLFTGNHRVAKVKVSRDGAELGVAELDVDVRTAQALGDFGGGGGVYRLELVELRPGSNARWREACISELHFLGSAPNAAAGARVPTVGIGTLPAPYVPPTADREEIARTHVNKIGQIDSSWKELVEFLFLAGVSAPEDLADFRQDRRRWLERIASWVEPVSPDHAAAVMAREAASVDWAEPMVAYPAMDADLAAATEALTSVADFLGDDPAKCRTARANGGMRLVLLSNRVAVRAAEDGELSELDIALGTALDQWRNDTRGTARRLERVTRPTIEPFAALYDAIVADIAIARPACGW